VGAGLGGGFENTSELQVMNYNEAMESNDTEKWKLAAKEEYERTMKHNVFQEVTRDEGPEGAKILTLTRATKKKSNGTFRARMNARELRLNLHIISCSQ
jgi:hypothetical protein